MASDARQGYISIHAHTCLLAKGLDNPVGAARSLFAAPLSLPLPPNCSRTFEDRHELGWQREMPSHEKGALGGGPFVH